MTELPKLSRPARSALSAIGIDTLEALTQLSEGEFLALHGVGPASLPTIREALDAAKLDFRCE